MLKVNDKVKVHMYDTCNKEIKTRNYGTVFTVKEVNEKLGIDWNTEKSPTTCNGEAGTGDRSASRYDPETDSRNGKEFTYNSPIHENDTLFNGFSYREIMDVVIANYGHNITEKQFDKALKEFMDIRIEDMKENLMMCKANMLKEIRKV